MENGFREVVSAVKPSSNATSTREQSEIPVSPQHYGDPISLTSVGFREPPPTYTAPEAEFNQVITEEPPQYNNLFPPDVSIEESSENAAIVEQALTSAHFKEASGFSLNYSCEPCCPDLKIYPTLSHLPLLSVKPEGWKITGSTSDQCHCCCCFPPILGSKWQTMSLKQNGKEILNFVYSPKICCCGGRKDRIVDIYIPQRNQRIAVLGQGNKFSDAMVLIDYVTKSLFIVKNLEVQNPEAFAMTVISHHGIPVAIAQPIQGWSYRGNTTWSDFTLKFNTNVPQELLSVSSKAVVMVAFAMWTINYREDALIIRWRVTAVALIIGIIIFASIVIFGN